MSPPANIGRRPAGHALWFLPSGRGASWWRPPLEESVVVSTAEAEPPPAVTAHWTVNPATGWPAASRTATVGNCPTD